jgi:hypothetical protein
MFALFTDMTIDQPGLHGARTETARDISMWAIYKQMDIYLLR